MAAIHDLLKSAVDSGQRVTLVYLGGSSPGRPRPVVPLLLTDEDLVAVEPGSSTRKTYKVSRIASVQVGEAVSPAQPTAPANLPSLVPGAESLSAYVEVVRPELLACGWHLHESEDSFGVGTRFKNGKPRKTPSVLISYFDPTRESVIDLEGNEVSVRRQLTGRERPWRVDSWRFTKGATFSSLSKAFACFLEEVRSSDPANSKLVFAGHQ
jgi:hypothetical protein